MPLPANIVKQISENIHRSFDTLNDINHDKPFVWTLKDSLHVAIGVFVAMVVFGIILFLFSAR